MTNLEVISKAFQGLLAQACLFALLAIVGVAAAAKILKKIRVAFSSLWRKSRFSFAAVMLLSLTMFLWADKTNLLRMIIHPGGSPVVVSAEDILRGFRLEGIVTNDEPLCDKPVDAVEYPPWRLRAGRHTEFTLDLGDFVFPYGTNVINRFRVLPGGTIETFPAQGARVSICAARKLASLSPGVSRFWSADANGGAEKVLRWDSVFANDDRTGGYSAEIRLSANGDFSTRSNEVESVFRRVSPYDWDGDGLANEIDANPYESDGDFFGPANILPEGANSNAYCSVDIVVDGWDALVTFTGNKPSNYPDPRFVAKAGATNSVLVLIGKEYVVSSDAAMRCAGVSDAETIVVPLADGRLSVVRPVQISYSEESGDPPLRLGGPTSGGDGEPVYRRFSMNVQPASLGGEFMFESSCCPVSGWGLAFSYLTFGDCGCGGCSAECRYAYEGFSLDATAPTCGCTSGGSHGGTPPQPSSANPVSLSFSRPIAVYEDPHVDIVGERRTGKMAYPVTLDAGIFGGANGGSWTLAISNEDKLRKISGPSTMSGTVSPGETATLEIKYKADSPSESVGDIVATLTFQENLSGTLSTATASLTSVRAELRPNVRLSDQVEYRHVFGVAEDVSCRTVPASVPGLNFQAYKGTLSMVESDLKWTCPTTNAVVWGGLALEYNGEMVHNFMTTTYPPLGVEARHCYGYDFGLANGVAGGVGMKMELFVLPSWVSFWPKLSVAEVPTTTAGPTGYFTNTMFSSVWYHTINLGAGKWSKVEFNGNPWIWDDAIMGDEFPSNDDLPWRNGSIVWDIPMAWELTGNTNTLYSNRFPVTYQQIFTFNSNGTLRVSKHGFWVERDPDGTRRGSEGVNIWIQYED